MILIMHQKSREFDTRSWTISSKHEMVYMGAFMSLFASEECGTLAQFSTNYDSPISSIFSFQTSKYIHFMGARRRFQGVLIYRVYICVLENVSVRADQSAASVFSPPTQTPRMNKKSVVFWTNLDMYARTAEAVESAHIFKQLNVLCAEHINKRVAINCSTIKCCIWFVTIILVHLNMYVFLR